ncbi:hypothetical protein AYM40_14195 [Paraburkholderia phytofirmans OLGA172]|uniref:Uncharacterized protein n=1 Tax=Paraburkholderia phytofirmans OLGA172 TaxID=1417228 RepID=A0A160FLK7_9BURK|nr:hypothetical protein AYM40_14195 [Paraburkholderia phytofirmans OLGA172]
MHETRSRPLTLRDSGIDGSLMFARDVDFRVTGDIGFMIHDMAATLTPMHAGQPIVFDDPTSVTINVHRGDVTLDSARLTAIFNRYLFQYQGSPLRNMRVMPQDCSERHPLLGNRPGNPSATANWVVRVRSAASAGAARNHAQ